MYVRCHPVRDKKLYDLYLEENPYCQVCGCPWRGLSRHHIMGGVARSDERTNLLVCCLILCHPLMEGLRVTIDGIRYEPITLGQQLAIKKLRTSGEYDEARLTRLHGMALPELEEIPEWVRESFRKFQPSAEESK